MDHERYADLVALYAFGYVEAVEREQFEAHLEAGCEPCRAALAEYEEVAADVEYGAVALEPSLARSRGLLGTVRAEAAPAPMRGRERALRTALARVEAVARGEGSLLSIVGEAGIGKSRLVAELERVARDRGAIVLQGSSGSSGSDLGYNPFIECLRSWSAGAALGEDATQSLRQAVAALRAGLSPEVLPAIARLLSLELDTAEAAVIEGIEGDALERLIHKTVGELFAAIAHQRAVVLVFEDLHWADPSTIEMLEAVAALVDTSAVLVVCVSRPGYPETSGRIAEYAAREHALRNHRLVIDALGEDDIRAMVRDILGSAEFPEALVEFVVAKSEGNPFFAEQAVRSLLDSGVLRLDDGHAVLDGELPAEGIGSAADEAIARRLSALDSDERDVLEAAAVVGRYVHHSLLACLVDDSVDLAHALAGLQQRDLLIERRSRATAQAKVVALVAEKGYVFKHAILRDAVYESIDGDRRASLHLSCAAALEETFAKRLSDFYAALAVHYARGGDLAKATDYLLDSGSQAVTSAASVEALRLFREAHRVYRLAYGSHGPSELEARLEANLAVALVNTGHLTESIAHFNNALRLHGQWVPESKAGLHAKLAWDVPNVLTRLYTGRMLRTRKEVGEKERQVYSLMYNRCRAQNVVDAQRNFFDNFAVIHYGVRHGDPTAVDHAAGFLAATGAFFAWAGISFRIGGRFLEVARDLADRGAVVDRFLYQTMAFVYHFHRGNWGAEHDIAAATWAEGLRHGMLWDADVYLGMRCERDLRQGHFERAEIGIETLRQLCDDYGYGFARSNEYAQAAYLAVERRDLGSAHHAAQRWYESRQEETLHVLALGTRAKIEVLEGEHDTAAQTLAAVDDILQRDTVVTPYHSVVPLASRLRLAVARVERATGSGGSRPDALIAAGYSAVKPALRASAKVFRERTEVLGLSARLSWLAGRHEEAFGRWQRALDAGESGAVRPELARIARDIGLALIGRRSTEFLGLGADGWLARARAGFEELGAGFELAELETAQERRRTVA